MFPTSHHVDLKNCTLTDVHGDQNVYHAPVYSGPVYNGIVYNGDIYRGDIYEGDVYKGNVYKGDVYKGDVYKRTVYGTLPVPNPLGEVEDSNTSTEDRPTGKLRKSMHNQNAKSQQTASRGRTYLKSPSSDSASKNTRPDIVESVQLAERLRRMEVKDALPLVDPRRPRAIREEYADEGSEAEECDVHDGPTVAAARWPYTPLTSPTSREQNRPLTPSITYPSRPFLHSRPPSAAKINTRPPHTREDALPRVTRKQSHRDLEKVEEWHLGDGRPATTEGWSSTPPTSARPKPTPSSPFTPPLNPPRSCTPDTNTRKPPRTCLRDTPLHTLEPQFHQHSGTAMHYRGVYNNSYNITTNNTRDSYNDSSVALDDWD